MLKLPRAFEMSGLLKFPDTDAECLLLRRYNACLF